MHPRPFVAAFAAALLVTACSDTPSTTLTGRTSIELTDAPFPYDVVGRVDVFIETIEASVSPDTSGGPQTWVTVASPNRIFNMLDFQQGRTTVLGEAQLPATQYRAIRLVMRTDQSRILSKTGAPMTVHWGSSTGTATLYALVERPLAVGSGDSRIVIDFDVGRSFLCVDPGCVAGFYFSPWLRAVTESETGSLAGAVRATNIEGGPEPIGGASITVYQGNAGFSEATWHVAATGATDNTGTYRIAFLLPGTYIVRVDPPRGTPFLAGLRSAVTVAKGQETIAIDFTLQPGDGAELRMDVDSLNIKEGGSTLARLTLARDGQSQPIDQSTWTSSDTSVVTIAVENPSRARLIARRVGTTQVVARVGGLSTTAILAVIPASSGGPVATVSVQPSTLTMSVGDSLGLQAIARDSAGRELSGRSFTWSVSNSQIVLLNGFGQFAILRGLRSGSSTVTATADGKSGSSLVTVR